MNKLLPPSHLDGCAVLGSARSSFRPAFWLLPRDRRRDLATLYAFCRTVDDLADAGDYPQTMRREALDAWREAFRRDHGLPSDLRDLLARRKLPKTLFFEILDGVGTDLEEPVRMRTRADLELYCHRVAGAVGLLCLPIFGADATRGAAYAEALGSALQRTNILRDTCSDLARGRLYYPLDELAEAGLDADRFFRPCAERRKYLEGFAASTGAEFARAARAEPPEDRRALRPARVMAAVYAALLAKIRQRGIPPERVKLTRAEKARAVAAALLGF